MKDYKSDVPEKKEEVESLSLSSFLASENEPRELMPVDIELRDAVKHCKASEKEKDFLEYVRASFMNIKDAMYIPRKPVRKPWLSMTENSLNPLISKKLDQTNKDRMVLANAEFLEDMYGELIPLAEKIHIIETKLEKLNQQEEVKEEQKREGKEAKIQRLHDSLRAAKEDFGKKKDQMLIKLRAKQLYLNAKNTYLLSNQEPDDLQKFDEAFKAYCECYPYDPEVVIPEAYKNDATIVNDKRQVDALQSDDYRKELSSYFRSANTGQLEAKSPAAMLKFLASEFTEGVRERGDKFAKGANHILTNINEGLQDLQKTTNKLASSIIPLKLKSPEHAEAKQQKKKEEKDAKQEQVQASEAPVTIPKDSEREWLAIALKNQKILIMDGKIKAFHEKIRDRIKVLKETEDQLKTKREEYQRKLDALEKLKTELGFSVFYEEFFHKISAISKRIQDLQKSIQDKIHTEICDKKCEWENEINELTVKINELNELKKQLDEYKKLNEHLKGKTLSSTQIGNMLQQVKTHSEKHWAGIMQGAFADVGRQTPEMAGQLREFYHSETEFLQSLVKDKSITEKLLSGVKVVGPAAVVGAGAGFLSGLFSSDPSSAIWKAGMGGLLFSAVSVTLYDTMRGDQEDSDDLRKQFYKEMKEAGFNNKYKHLFAKFSELIIYRELILLGKTVKKRNLRKEFIEKYNLDPNADKLTLDANIETIFDAELDELLKHSFNDIYQIHEKEIEKEKERKNQIFSVSSMVKLWQGEEEYAARRQVSTTQMRIVLRRGVAAHYQNQMDSKNFKPYRAFAAFTVATFTAGAIALSFVSGGIFPLIGMACCIAGAIATLVSAKRIPHSFHKYLPYKYGSAQRARMKQTVEKLEKQSRYMEEAGKKTVATGLAHQKGLQKFNKATYGSVVTRMAGLLKDSWKRPMPFGTAHSWARDWSARYRHDVFMEVDYRGPQKTVTENAALQTQKVSMDLLAYMTLDGPLRGKYAVLKQYIESCKIFLNDQNQDPELSAVRKTMEELHNIKDKIREQFLEIVSSVPDNGRELPEELVAFYTGSGDNGEPGLGGSANDLIIMRQLRTLKDIQTAAERLCITISGNNPPVLAGSNAYRKLLRTENAPWSCPDSGLGSMQPNTPPLNKNNIKSYLRDSLTFMANLGNKELIPANMKAEYAYSKEYIIYRALLLKQLAEILDPGHKNYNPSLEKEILAFAKNHLLLNDPEAVFREILHQGYVTEHFSRDGTNAYTDGIVDAIRISLTFDTRRMTPKFLIEQEISKNILENKNLFGFTAGLYEDKGADGTPDYLTMIQNTVADTEKLLSEIMKNKILVDFHVPQIFMTAALAEIQKFLVGIDVLLRNQQTPDDMKANLNKAKQTLELHQLKIQLVQAIHLNQELPNPPEIEGFHLEYRANAPTKIHKGFFRDAEEAGVAYGPANDAEAPTAKATLVGALLKKPWEGGDKVNELHFNKQYLLGDELWKRQFRQAMQNYIQDAADQPVAHL